MLNGYQLFIHMFLGCSFGLQWYLEGPERQQELVQGQITAAARVRVGVWEAAEVRYGDAIDEDVVVAACM